MRLRTAGTRPLATGQMLGSLLRSNSWCSSTTIRVRLKPHHRMACAADRRAVRRVCTALYGCATGRPGILELEHVFFQDMKLTHPHLRGETLRPSGLADWAAMQPQLEPLVKQKIIIGFMLGDGGCAAPAPRSSRWQKLARVLIVITLSCCSRDCVEQYQLGGRMYEWIYIHTHIKNCLWPLLLINEGGAPLWGNYNSQSALYPMLVVLAVWSLPVG